MEKWEYCYVLQNPDDTGVLFFSAGENDDQAERVPGLGTSNGRRAIDELGKEGWETISVSALREDSEGKVDYQKKPVYKWVLKRPVHEGDSRLRMAHD